MACADVCGPSAALTRSTQQLRFDATHDYNVGVPVPLCCFCQERLAAAVTETITAAEAAADEAAQQIMTLQQDLSRLQATNAALHATLEEVHAAAASYKDQLGTAADRERELQRKLLQAQLMYEEQAEQLREQQQAIKALQAAVATAAPGPVSDAPAGQSGSGVRVEKDGQGEEGVVQVLLQQRDAANAALCEARERLRAQEAELQQLRNVLQAAGGRQGGGGAAGAANAGASVSGTGMKPPPLALQGLQQQQPQQDAAAAVAGEPSGSSWLGADWQSGLPSPTINKLLATPGSGASFWLDSAREHEQEHQPTSPAAAARGVGRGGDVAAASTQLLQQGQRSGRAGAERTRATHPLSLSADSGLSGRLGAARGAGVAALAAQLLNREASTMNSISTSLEDVALCMMGSPSSPRPASRLQQHSMPQHGRQLEGQVQEQQRLRELAAALIAAQATTERQRAVISALRQEMEELQAAGGVGCRRCQPSRTCLLLVCVVDNVLLLPCRVRHGICEAGLPALGRVPCRAGRWGHAGSVYPHLFYVVCLPHGAVSQPPTLHAAQPGFDISCCPTPVSLLFAAARVCSSSG